MCKFSIVQEGRIKQKHNTTLRHRRRRWWIFSGGWWLSVDSTMRRLVGWVRWAAEGCKCTNLRNVESTGEMKAVCCFFSIKSWIMTTPSWKREKEDMVDTTTSYFVLKTYPWTGTLHRQTKLYFASCTNTFPEWNRRVGSYSASCNNTIINMLIKYNQIC